MTRKLYYEDGYQTSFTATIISCEIGEKGYEVVLNQTAFYPEGGGQPADTGTLKDAQVIDVQIKEGVIYHRTNKPLEVGEEVQGQIDFRRRFDLMQQHSGEHIVSGIVKSKYGYNNVGFHLNHDYMTCDFDGELTKEQIQEIELLANEAIYKNLPIDGVIYKEDEIKEKDYRSKLDLTGAIRLVTISEYDTCACCGVHVKTTGEIGMIKCVSSERHRGGVRMTWLCGKRALKDYDKKQEIVSESAKVLSSKSDSIVKHLTKLQRELNEAKQKIAGLTNELFQYKSEAYLKTDKPALMIYEAELQGDNLRRLCLMISEKTDKVVLVLTGEAENFKYALSAKEKDIRPFNKLLTEQFNGKGGGKSELCQGNLVGSKEEIEAFFDDYFIEKIEKNIF